MLVSSTHAIDILDLVKRQLSESQGFESSRLLVQEVEKYMHNQTPGCALREAAVHDAGEVNELCAYIKAVVYPYERLAVSAYESVADSNHPYATTNAAKRQLAALKTRLDNVAAQFYDTFHKVWHSWLQQILLCVLETTRIALENNGFIEIDGRDEVLSMAFVKKYLWMTKPRSISATQAHPH